VVALLEEFRLAKGSADGAPAFVGVLVGLGGEAHVLGGCGQVGEVGVVPQDVLGVSLPASTDLGRPGRSGERSGYGTQACAPVQTAA
jgi:hypothetical protein